MYKKKYYFVYILTNRPRGVFYTGITSQLTARIWQHKDEKYSGFTKKYNTKILVWYEVHEVVNEAIKREKLIKRWKRDWKIELIEKENPNWNDLFETLL